jgi:hypothetical protein
MLSQFITAHQDAGAASEAKATHPKKLPRHSALPREVQKAIGLRAGDLDEVLSLREQFLSSETLDLSLAETLDQKALCTLIHLLARQYVIETGLFWKESMARASNWSCRFLSMDRSSLAAFFVGVRCSAIAQSCPAGRALALAAGCHAWQSLRADPTFTPTGSLRARLRELKPSEREKYLNATARFHHDSCRLEGVEIPVEKIAAQLKAGLA